MLSLLHGFFHLRRRYHPTLDALPFRLLAQDEPARRCFVRHDDLGLIHLSRPSLYFFKQPCPTSMVVYKPPSLRFVSIHRNAGYRVLVSQIDSNENVIHHDGPVSFQKVWLCFTPSQSRDWPFLHSELLAKEGNANATNNQQRDWRAFAHRAAVRLHPLQTVESD